MTPLELDALHSVVNNTRASGSALRKALRSALEEIGRARFAVECSGGCANCYSREWVPCDKDAKGARRDPRSPGRWMVCGPCCVMAKAKSDA